MRMIKIFSSSFISIWMWIAFWMIFLGTAFQLYGSNEKVPNDIRWIRQSLEYERLCEQRLAKMSRERNEQRKQLIFDFPNQFSSATGKLTEFINLTRIFKFFASL